MGGSWNRDGVIVFADTTRGLMQVSAAGGVASPLTTIDPSRKEVVHVLPSFLPDGRHFLYLRASSIPENSGVYVGSLNTKPEEQDSRRLLATTSGPVYVPSSDSDSGQVLFLRQGTLMAQPFDARSAGTFWRGRSGRRASWLLHRLRLLLGFEQWCPGLQERCRAGLPTHMA